MQNLKKTINGKIHKIAKKIKSILENSETPIVLLIALSIVSVIVPIVIGATVISNGHLANEKGQIGDAANTKNESSKTGKNKKTKTGYTPFTAPKMNAGIRTSFGANTLAANSYVKGGQVYMDWREIEPTKGTFCWDNPHHQKADGSYIGCGTSVSNSSNGLTSQLQYFSSIGKNATVQVNSTNKPSWIYDAGSGVELCGHEKILFYAGSYDIPMYWQSDGSLNMNYFNMMQEMINSFAQQLRTSPYKSSIIGVRTSPNLVGTEFNVADPSQVKVGGPITLSSPNCSAQSAWTNAVGNNAYAYVMKMNYNAFEPDIRPIIRQTAYTSLGSYSLDPNIYLAQQAGKIQPWFFVTSANGDAPFETKGDFANKWAKTGKAVGYEEQVINSVGMIKGQSPDQNAVSWNYWTILMQLDKGISHLATFSNDIILGQSNDEYTQAFNFANKYAGFNQSNEAQSPGAWIAFAPGSPGDSSVTNGNFSMFLNEDVSDGSVGVDSLGTPSGGSCFLYGPPCPGIGMVGSVAQRFGRWSRKTNMSSGHSTILLSMDSSFKNSLPGTIAAYITYLDCGSGSFKLNWGGGSSDSINKSGALCPSKNSGKWVTTPEIDIPANQINRTVSGNDFGITVIGGDTSFHMLEIVK